MDAITDEQSSHNLRAAWFDALTGIGIDPSSKACRITLQRFIDIGIKPGDLLATPGIARLTNLSAGAFVMMRARRQGPKFTRVIQPGARRAGRIFYSALDAFQWMQDGRVEDVAA